MLEYAPNRPAGSPLVEQVPEGKRITLPREPLLRVARRVLRSRSFWIPTGLFVVIINLPRLAQFGWSVIRDSAQFDAEATATAVIWTAAILAFCFVAHALFRSATAERLLLSPHECVFGTKTFGGAADAIAIPRTRVLGVRVAAESVVLELVPEPRRWRTPRRETLLVANHRSREEREFVARLVQVWLTGPVGFDEGAGRLLR